MKSDTYKETERDGAAVEPVPFSPEAIGTRIEALAARVGGKRELANLSGIHEAQLYKISHNKEYKDLIVPKERLDELQIIGRAVWAGGWLI